MDSIKSAISFLIGSLAVAVVLFALLGSIALVVSNGASQTCSRQGGHWYATDTPVAAGVDRIRECQQ